MGWGQIAKDMGFKLGQVVAPQKPTKPARLSRPKKQSKLGKREKASAPS
jgi:hypothetical protein